MPANREPGFGGAISAAVTPLREGGDAVDLNAIGPMVEHLIAAGVDGILALGTTGEGILLSTAERRAAAEAFVQAGRGQVICVTGPNTVIAADTLLGLISDRGVIFPRARTAQAMVKPLTTNAAR